MVKKNRASMFISTILGASAQNSQELDVRDFFRDLVRKLKVTIESEAFLLKKIFTKMLNECDYLTCRNKDRQSMMIDAASIALEAQRRSITRNKINNKE